MGRADVLKRVVIEGVSPELDGGRFPVKRTIGEKTHVQADIFADGHDAISCALLHKHAQDTQWTETPMALLGNDRWQATFRVTEMGSYLYTIQAWIDPFKTWQRDFSKKMEAGQSVDLDVLMGLDLIEKAQNRAAKEDAALIDGWKQRIQSAPLLEERALILLDPELERLIARWPDKRTATVYDRTLAVQVDRARARFSTWYELFPRSSAREQRRHGSFRECEALLPYVAEMGFDVLYLPPIHPIGVTHRKGRNNAPAADPQDPGSPWAIGAAEGGHKAIHPELGTLSDFRRLAAKARGHGLEIALDLAFQCTPDHPYVKTHPQWFRHRPDGTIQYAENPPKRYQDIYPFHFESEDWQSLFEELKGVVDFWIDEGVSIFRVDNPHTKPFAFWEWLIDEIRRTHPDVIFLAEAFTRPKVMYRLAKLGFSQSYTYFAWRNTAWEIREYFTELTRSPVREFFRPNLWPNTPDILTEYLQMGGRPAFMVRLVLAATLGASYGIYGPAFELCENRSKTQGSEEYLDSEKYEIRHWETDSPLSLKDFISRVNRIRSENPALQSDWTLRFHETDNDQILCYSKHTEDLSNIVLVVANLDPHHVHASWLLMPIEDFGLQERQPYQVHDLLSGARYLWHGGRNYVEINPQVSPAHILRIRRRIRTEHDFDYFL
jgi:starch synthase (maltosyl-transferring)